MPTKTWMEERQQVTAWLLPQEYDRLRRACKEADMSIADVLRAAIQRMLETVPEAPQAHPGGQQEAGQP